MSIEPTSITSGNNSASVESDNTSILDFLGRTLSLITNTYSIISALFPTEPPTNETAPYEDVEVVFYSKPKTTDAEYEIFDAEPAELPSPITIWRQYVAEHKRMRTEKMEAERATFARIFLRIMPKPVAPEDHSKEIEALFSDPFKRVA